MMVKYDIIIYFIFSKGTLYSIKTTYGLKGGFKYLQLVKVTTWTLMEK